MEKKQDIDKTKEIIIKGLDIFEDIMKAKKDHLAEIITSEQGKTIKEAKFEVESAIKILEFFGTQGVRMFTKVIPSTKKNKKILTVRRPLGIVGIITPWNFPLSIRTK